LELPPVIEKPMTVAEAELRGLPYMQDIVEKRNVFKKPYRISLADRAEALGEIEKLQELQKRAEEVRSLLLARTGDKPTPEQIEWARDTMRGELLALARGARAFTMHHRVPPFRVGAAMLALREVSEKDANPWVIMFSANTKVDDDKKATKEGEKWCAEQYLMDRITEPTCPGEEGIKKVIAFAVSGEARSDDVSALKGVEQITLTPCAICRDRMNYDPELTTGEEPIIPLTTEVVSQDINNLGIQKWQKVGEMHGFHGERREED
jgi:cytidine deaminase